MINYELDGKSPSLKVRLLAESVEAQQTHTPTQTSRREHVQNANLQNGNSVRFNVQYREKANPEEPEHPKLKCNRVLRSREEPSATTLEWINQMSD